MSEIVAKITNLSHKYKDVIALEDINFVAEPGKTTAIIGSTGCGKSTLLYCLCGLLQYNGTITFNHEVIDKKFSKMIGFIKQNNDLIPSYTVEENIMAGS